MLMTRRKIHNILQPGPIVTHAMVDSSLQGGHDYELVSLCMVSAADDLPDLHVNILKRAMTLAEREEWFEEKR